ncbi:hypothetical protein AB0392_11370 [Nonomuraea angiospora]|uniref:hypothetical protein n=1 Tax=Nonomuraea angiospora TaxID=46172 RepID=UPI00344FC5B1
MSSFCSDWRARARARARADADAGDLIPAYQIAEQEREEELRARADAGGRNAAYQLADLLYEQGREEAREFHELIGAA